MRSSRSGTLAYDTAGANLLGDYARRRAAGTCKGVYQFMPRWRVGLRTERLDPGTVTYVVGRRCSTPTATTRARTR